MSSTLLIDVPTDLPSPASRKVSLDKLRLKCITMETGLIDLRLALKTMRTTCVALEMHAEMLELEIADLKNIHTPDPASIDQYEDGFRSTMNNLKLSSDINNRVANHSNLLTPPATPISGTGRDRRDSLSISAKRISKRSSSDAALEDWDVRESCLDPRPRTSRKRVRFADIQETVSISNIGTPFHEVPSSSSSDYPPPPTPLFSFRLPEIIAPYSSEPDVRQNEKTDLTPSHSSTKVRLPRRTKDCRSRIRSGDRVSTQNVLHRKRTKTRWDPSTGKRVPVATAVVDDSGSRELTSKAPTEGEDNYELRLSESLSNTSLGK